ncbi:chemotaxis protein CheW [Pseudoduganella ginsengisoli]|uniref:Chemotaxis protein CheW n=1 Tax=Pseudoduganella ginsengisoli TaxID=1462440 RepID=A0A6L6Q8H2_9BURK|nr:chemotaxis protein CheW [Pseudoduganella ginsengisoli]MTW06087.1 chemotaxis protein CheW [Pseudoduganella ginsengisoli]
MTDEAILEHGGHDAAHADESGEAQSDTRQFVTFEIAGEMFAVDMAPVQEIIRVPAVVRVPLAPATLDGLSNLRGRVLPIISLRRLFGFDMREHDDLTRAVVIDLGQPLGFVVDRVASVIDVDPERIEGVSGIRSTVDSELLTGILKDVAGCSMVMVLDFGKLVAQQFEAISALARGASSMAGAAGAEAANEEQQAADELQLVNFTVAEQEYAIDIASVQEIVQVPPNIVHVPNSPSHVLGLMTLRERLLPLVSLRSLFGLAARQLDERSRVVVAAIGETAVGIVTDSVSEVLRVPAKLVDAMPALLAKNSGMADIGQICRLDNGKRLVGILAVDRICHQGALQQVMESIGGNMEQLAEGTAGAMDAAEEAGNDDEEQVVVFHLADGEFGVPIAGVQEIVRVPEELTHVPKAAHFVEGVINLRGAVLPVIDQRKRLDLAPIDRNDRQRIMVFLIKGVRIGFIVDAVTEVLKIPRTAIEPAPRLSQAQARLLGRVANLEKHNRMIQLIEPVCLVDGEDSEALARLAA